MKGDHTISIGYNACEIRIVKRVKVPFVSKLFLLLGIVLVALFFIVLPLLLSPKIPQANYVGLVLIGGVILFFLMKFFFWNAFGKECLRIDKTSLSWNFDYKFIKTSPESVFSSRIFIDFDCDKMRTGSGNIRYFSQNAQTDLIELIFESCVVIPKKDFLYLHRILEAFYDVPEATAVKKHQIKYTFSLN